MNLRIGPEQIRFRITADEFATLIEHGALSNGTSFGESANIYYGVRTHRAAANRDGSCLSLATHADDGTTRYILTVFSDGMAKLQNNGGGKDGICEHFAFENGDMLTIGLEIDLHSKRNADKS